MSRTDCCYDNAAMEGFFWSLKYEWTNHRTHNHQEVVRRSVFLDIERFTIPCTGTRRSATSHQTNTKPNTPRHKRHNPAPAVIRPHTFVAQFAPTMKQQR